MGSPGAARRSKKLQFALIVELSYVYSMAHLAQVTYSARRQAKGLRFRVLSFYYVVEEGERSRVQPSCAGGRA